MAEDDALNRLVAAANTGRTLVVGNKVYEGSHDRRVLYAQAIGVDMQPGYGVDLVHDMEVPLPESVGLFDHVDLCSVLEHCKRPWKMAAAVQKALKPGGSLLVSAPFVWRVHAYPSDYWRFTPAALDVLFPGIGWRERGFLVNGRIVKLVRGIETEEFGTCMQRAETVALGRKCV